MKHNLFYRLILMLLLNGSVFSSRSQVLLQNYTLRRWDNERFIVGVSPDTNQTEILIRPDSTMQRILNKATQQDRSYYIDFNASGCLSNTLINSMHVTIDRQGVLKKNYGPYTVGFDGLPGKRTLLLGNVTLKAAERRKVRWLDLYDRQVIPDLNGFKRLETVYINHDVYNPSISVNHEYFDFYYPGDLFLWRKFYNKVSLKSIHVDVSYDGYDFYRAGYISFLDAPNDSLVALPQLHALHLENIDYFTVNFGELKKLDYLALSGLQRAEMINLAIVMKSFGKNPDSGAWSWYLEKADVSRLPSINPNGVFETFYANGTKLCFGTFRNGKPDGIWGFWDEKGKLVQERIYANGNRTGNWIFKAENTEEPEADTSLMLTYSNDQLVMRTEFTQGEAYYFDSGHDRQFGERARGINRVTIRTGSNPSVKRENDVINIANGDTMKSIRELYSLSGEEWSYSKAFYCKSCQDDFSYDFKGKMGFPAYFNRKTEGTKNPKRKQVIEIDLKACTIRHSEEESIGNEIKRTQYERPIDPEEWKCN